MVSWDVLVEIQPQYLLKPLLKARTEAATTMLSSSIFLEVKVEFIFGDKTFSIL